MDVISFFKRQFYPKYWSWTQFQIVSFSGPTKTPLRANFNVPSRTIGQCQESGLILCIKVSHRKPPTAFQQTFYFCHNYSDLTAVILGIGKNLIGKVFSNVFNHNFVTNLRRAAPFQKFDQSVFCVFLYFVLCCVLYSVFCALSFDIVFEHREGWGCANGRERWSASPELWVDIGIKPLVSIAPTIYPLYL